MQIYHYHPETHFFLGTSQADPSPLEPGMYLIPAFATTEPVPDFDPEVERVRWVGGVWQVEAIPEPEPPQPDFDNFRKDIEVILTEPFLHQLGLSNISLMLFLRDGFLNKNLTDILTYWNRAITNHGTELIAILESDYNGDTKANFARAKAAQYNLPIILRDDYLLEVIS